jgi:cytochrome b involved in lipid metabolism
MRKHTLLITCITVFVAVFTFVFIKYRNVNATTQLASTTTPVTTNIQTTLPIQTACIITINGTRYDVTSYMNMHSGGNIFQCGTDMTAAFNSQHNSSYMSMMAKYKVI